MISLRNLKSLRWLASGGFSLALFAQPQSAPLTHDPLELVTGPAQPACTAASREAALQLLDRARDHYGLRQANLAYDLKVSFTVNSGGQTAYDGNWTMEDISDPGQGLRWTATASSGYSTTEISANGMFYGEGTAPGYPLRLQEARAALFDPMPSSSGVSGQIIRTAPVNYNGAQLTCILLAPRPSTDLAPGRRWEETEECIDPQTGLLRLHSQVPGRYYAYDYSNAPQLGVFVLPRTVTVSEAGHVISTINVDSLTELPAADPSLFVPTAQMQAQGPPVAMGEAEKRFGFLGRRPASGQVARPVGIFGLVSSTGKLVEAHSLQPSDPNSAAALQAAGRIQFAQRRAAGARPQQHFVFIIEKFAE